MGMKFMEGAAVEVRVPDGHDMWFPATILKEIDKDFFLVEYNFLNIEGEEYLQDNVDALNIRPSQPVTLVDSFDVFERVDAFFDFGWWNGVVLEVLATDADKDYMVCFEHEQNLKKLKKFQLRRHMEWMNGQWLEDSLDMCMIHEQSDVHRTDILHAPRVTNTSNTTIASKTYKRKRDIERNTNNTVCQISLQTTEEEEASCPKKRGTCQELAGFLSSSSNELSAPTASVHDKSCSNQNTTDLSKPVFSVKAALQNDSSRTLVKCSQIPDSQGSTRDLDSEENEQHKEVLDQQAATFLTRTIEQSEDLISESADGGPNVHNIHVEILRLSEELSGSPTSSSPEKIETVLGDNNQKEGEISDSSRDLIKCSQNLELQDGVTISGSRQEINLDTIKSYVATFMEKFGVASQVPHFQQLQQQPECLRVGRGIGYKLSYLSLINNVKTIQIREPKIKLEKKLEALLELETLGFDVQLFKPRVIEMISLKDRQVQLRGMLKEYEVQMVEMKQCMECLRVELNEVVEKMLETGRNFKAVQMEKEKVELEKKKKRDRVSALRRKAEEIKERVERSSKEFRSVAAMPW